MDDRLWNTAYSAWFSGAFGQFRSHSLLAHIGKILAFDFGGVGHMASAQENLFHLR